MIEFGEVERMYLRNYLRDGERHLIAATVLFENGFYDFSVKEAYESMLWNIDALLLTVGIQTYKSSTAIAWFGKKFVNEGIYPPEFYEHLLLTNSSYRIADSEFGATITNDEASSILGYAQSFRDIVAYLKEFKVETSKETDKEGKMESGKGTTGKIDKEGKMETGKGTTGKIDKEGKMESGKGAEEKSDRKDYRETGKKGEVSR